MLTFFLEKGATYLTNNKKGGEIGERWLASKAARLESRVLYIVLRSPHIDKKSREQLEMEIKKKYLVIKT